MSGRPLRGDAVTLTGPSTVAGSFEELCYSTTPTGSTPRPYAPRGERGIVLEARGGAIHLVLTSGTVGWLWWTKLAWEGDE